MITRYFVNCFERELCIKWDDAYKHLEKEILDMLDGYYYEWHSTEEIEDPDYRAYVEERAAFDDNITNKEYCEIVEYANVKIKNWRHK